MIHRLLWLLLETTLRLRWRKRGARLLLDLSLRSITALISIRALHILPLPLPAVRLLLLLRLLVLPALVLIILLHVPPLIVRVGDLPFEHLKLLLHLYRHLLPRRLHLLNARMELLTLPERVLLLGQVLRRRLIPPLLVRRHALRRAVGRHVYCDARQLLLDPRRDTALLSLPTALLRIHTALVPTRLLLLLLLLRHTTTTLRQPAHGRRSLLRASTRRGPTVLEGGQLLHQFVARDAELVLGVQTRGAVGYAVLDLRPQYRQSVLVACLLLAVQEGE